MTWPGAAAAALARPAEHPLRTAAPTALAVLAGLSAAYLFPPAAIVVERRDVQERQSQEPGAASGKKETLVEAEARA